jgi:GAF domain-containing protein
MPTPHFAGRLGELARDLRTLPDPASTLRQVVEAAVQLFDGCTGAGITLADKNGAVRTSAASSDLHAELDRTELELGEGPCLDAIWDHKLILVADLGRDERWPRWAPVAVDQFGIRSMICVQLYTATTKLGSLSLSFSAPRAFDEVDIEELHALGAHAAAAIAASEHEAHLSTALQSRTVIGQATGLLMAKYDIPSAGAFNVLLRLSSEQNRKVVVLATEIVETWDATGTL